MNMSEICIVYAAGGNKRAQSTTDDLGSTSGLEELKTFGGVRCNICKRIKGTIFLS